MLDFPHSCLGVNRLNEGNECNETVHRRRRAIGETAR